MTISAEAIDAAAKQWTRLMCGCYDPEDVPHLHDELRKILEAAAPHMQAEAFDAGLAAEYARDKYGPYPANPYRSTK